MLSVSNSNTFSVGDYVSYVRETYNGGGGRPSYDYTTSYGYIIDDKFGFSVVVKQYGGQIWHGITPSEKITEDEFLSKFSLYNEFKKDILEKIHLLPEKLKTSSEDLFIDKITCGNEKMFTLIRIFDPKVGKLIGNIEFDYDGLDNIYDIKVDYV
jgi:hypothetical protein